MINFLGLNVIKPAQTIQNNSNIAFDYSKLGQKPDSFERSHFTTSPISFTGKSNRLKEYKELTQDLNQTAQTAQSSLDKQLATEGWSGKTADAISVLWNSKNRAKLVQADIDTYKDQVSQLEGSIKEDKFSDKFKEFFDVEYNHSNIVKYNRKAEQFENAMTADCIARYTDEKLSKNIETFDKLSGNLQDLNEYKTNPYATTGSVPYYNHLTTKDEIFSNMENSLVEVLGDKKVLDKILSANGLNSGKTPKEDKYKLYGYLSKVIVDSSRASAQKSLNGRTLSQMKEETDKSYEKAFGTNNDIIARVDNYNASQKVGAACVKFVTNVVFNTLGPGKVWASCIYSAGKSIAFDVADAKTKDVDNDVNLKLVGVNAVLSGIGGIVNRMIVNEYAGPVATKILGGNVKADGVGSMLKNFVVKEIISKEGVKVPAYLVEEITDSVVKKMTGLKKSDNGVGLSQEELASSMSVVAEAMTYLAVAKNNDALKNMSEKEMVSLVNEHITNLMKDDKNFNMWLNKNKAQYQQMLTQLVKNELPKITEKNKV